MAQTLENIKGGGGSIKVGAVGTIGALMTRELEATNSSSQIQLNSRSRLQTAPVSVPCGATPRRLQARKSLDEARSSVNSKIANNLTHEAPKRSKAYASSSDNTKVANNVIPEASRRSKAYAGSSRQVPMLGSDNISLDGTPNREKHNKKGPQLVDIVDIKCGDPRKSWVNPVASRLKKLGFAKLSETIV